MNTGRLRLLAACALATLLPLVARGSGDPLAETLARIVKAAEGGSAFAVLTHLCDRIGPRLSGSPQAEEAVRWTHDWLRARGLRTALEPVMVPRWQRGTETGEVLLPTRHRLVLTALGGSVPTPRAGLTADVVAVSSLEELEKLGVERVRGRIVLFHRVMTSASGPDGYGALSPLRTKGASAAARLGAVGCLVRSLTTRSARIAHTGTVTYATDAPQIPAAALAPEDADLLKRLVDTGERVRIRMRLGCRTLPDVPSHNVVADLVGREKPEEIVVVAGHLDSWDLGTGAVDDGAGVAAAMDTLDILRRAGLVPRRTIRAVLYMNEENGTRGARAYVADHAAELSRHVAAIESDSGAARPIGFTTNVEEPGRRRLAALIAPLLPLGAGTVLEGEHTGVDISYMDVARVPLIGLRQDTTRYFDYHHSAADTLDKVDPFELQQNVAAMAALAWALAEMPDTLPRPPAPAPAPSPAS